MGKIIPFPSLKLSCRTNLKKTKTKKKPILQHLCTVGSLGVDWPTPLGRLGLVLCPTE